MPERLYQLGFDENFRSVVVKDVTPEGFAGLEFNKGELLQLGRFVREIKEKPRIITPNDAAQYLCQNIFSPFEKFDQEEIWVLLLDNKQQVTHEVMVYRGTVNTVYTRSAELFKEAVRVNAPRIIMSHCHPSGDPSPSPEDVRLTQLANQAAKLLDIDLLDHIIVGKDRWVSMKEQGLGFE